MGQYLRCGITCASRAYSSAFTPHFPYICQHHQAQRHVLQDALNAALSSRGAYDGSPALLPRAIVSDLPVDHDFPRPPTTAGSEGMTAAGVTTAAGGSTTDSEGRRLHDSPPASSASPPAPAAGGEGGTDEVGPSVSGGITGLTEEGYLRSEDVLKKIEVM